MRRRYTYLLLFAFPAVLAAAITSVLVLGAVAGAMWIFVYGDNPWPPRAETTLVGLGAITFGSALAALLSIAYRAGRAQEGRPAFHAAHLRLAWGSSVLLVLGTLGYQWKVGNVGARSEGAACADFCTMRGFNGSSMPPKNSGLSICSCIDAQGRTAVTVPISEAAAALKAAGK